MHLDDAARQRKADAQASQRAIERAVGLDEQVEDALQIFSRDANPVVFHPHYNLVVDGLGRQSDGAALA